MNRKVLQNKGVNEAVDSTKKNTMIWRMLLVDKIHDAIKESNKKGEIYLIKCLDKLVFGSKPE